MEDSTKGILSVLMGVVSIILPFEASHVALVGSESLSLFSGSGMLFLASAGILAFLVVRMHDFYLKKKNLVLVFTLILFIAGIVTFVSELLAFVVR